MIEIQTIEGGKKEVSSLEGATLKKTCPSPHVINQMNGNRAPFKSVNLI